MESFTILLLSAILMNCFTFGVNGNMEIFVRDMNGDSIPVEVNVGSTVGDVKRQLNWKPLMQLRYKDRVLSSDSATISDLGIGAGSALDIHYLPTKEMAVGYLIENQFILAIRNTRVRDDNSEQLFIANLTTIKNLLLTEDMVNIEHILFVLIFADIDLNALQLFPSSNIHLQRISLLTFAIKSCCSLEVIQLLVDKFRLDVDAIVCGFPPLLNCCGKHLLNGVEIAQFLIAKGANVHLKLRDVSLLRFVRRIIKATIHTAQAHMCKEVESLLISAGAME